jgi:hypothetical protein
VKTHCGIVICSRNDGSPLCQVISFAYLNDWSNAEII